MTDLEIISKIAHSHGNSQLTSLEAIATFLNTDADNPMVYCVFRECNKDKLDADQLESVDIAIKVVKSQHLSVIRQNIEHMDKHLIADNINDDAHENRNAQL